MNNKYLLKTLSNLAFIVSAIFTIKLMLGNTIGFINSILIVLMSIIFEFSKCFFLYKTIESSKTNKAIKSISIIITLFLFCISILASLSFLQNETNKNKNKAITKSDSYKLQLQAKEQLKDLYDTKKEQIKVIQEQTKEQILALSNQRDSMPSNYITKKQEVNDKIQAIKEESNKMITKVNRQMEENLKEQRKEIDIKGVEMNSIKGYTAFLKVVSENISSEDTKYSVEQLEIVLFSMISIVFEFVAVLLYYYNKKEDVLSLRNENSSFKTQEETYDILQADASMLRKENKIGFNVENIATPIKTQLKTQLEIKQYTTKNKNVIKKYLRLKENNPSLGIKKISSELGVNEYQVKTIFGLLKNLGVIETEGKRSYIAMNEEEYNKMLEL